MTHNLTSDQSANHSMVYLRELCNPRNSYSAMVSAIELVGGEEAAGANLGFMGEVHGFETQLMQAWYVDERLTTLALGQCASGTLIRGALRTTLWHPLFGLSVCADKTSDYFFQPTAAMPAASFRGWSGGCLASARTCTTACCRSARGTGTRAPIRSS